MTTERGGAPSTFTQELADEICRRLMEGDSLRTICDERAMPDKSTVLRWVAERPEFRDQYARAREVAADTDADDIGHYARQAAEGGIRPDAANVAIMGLKWTAARRNPKKYGDASQLKLSGAVGVFDPSKFTDDQLRALLGVLEPVAASHTDGGGDPGGAEEA